MKRLDLFDLRRRLGDRRDEEPIVLTVGEAWALMTRVEDLEEEVEALNDDLNSHTGDGDDGECD